MNVRDALTRPEWFLRLAERYVNDGSPSGFTAGFRTSPATDPNLNEAFFFLQAIKDAPSRFEIFGSAPPGTEDLIAGRFFIHPDMANHPDLAGFEIMEVDDFRVVPTASSRTVQIQGSATRDYLKLHYDGVLGRINRRLHRMKAVAGPEVSAVLLKSIEEERLHSALTILHEPFAMLHLNKNIADRGDHWGMVWREYDPRGPQARHIAFRLPFFSLWSKDRRDPTSESLLSQLIKIWEGAAEAVIVERILYPIVDIYFQLVLKLGLLFEFHGQNALLGFDRQFAPIAVVLRDMMDVEKDITIRRSLGLNTAFVSAPYHIVSAEQGDFYQRRHSFSFDFKLAKYIIEPLIDAAADLGAIERTRSLEAVRTRVKNWTRLLPGDYFPGDGQWYSYEKVLTIDEKVLVPNTQPLLR